METIDSIVGDQNVMAERLSQMLSDALTPPRFGEFPMEYTDQHDLDIDYLINAAVNYQQQDIGFDGRHRRTTSACSRRAILGRRGPGHGEGAFGLSARALARSGWPKLMPVVHAF